MAETKQSKAVKRASSRGSRPDTAIRKQFIRKVTRIRKSSGRIAANEYIASFPKGEVSIGRGKMTARTIMLPLKEMRAAATA